MADVNTTAEVRQEENFERINKPDRILIFSGKRKSGKDFITDELLKRLDSQKSVIIKLSGPIKGHWAKTKNLDAAQLFSDGQYKEAYRLEMIKWSEKIRNNDYGYFCRAAIKMYNVDGKSIWIVSDARRKTDLKWFKENYGDLCRTIRIFSSEEVRKNRGWVFAEENESFSHNFGNVTMRYLLHDKFFRPIHNSKNVTTNSKLKFPIGSLLNSFGIDDSETECNLDDVSDWDLEIENNGEDLDFILKKILDLLH